MTAKTNIEMKEARKHLRLSQSQLAEETKKLGQTGIQWIEAGNPPSVESALLIADCLHRTVEELFGSQSFSATSEIAIALNVARAKHTTVEDLYGNIFLK